MLGTLGWQELLIILVIVALLFGASRVADMGSALGKGIREFRTSVKGDDEPHAEKPSVPAPPASPLSSLAARDADPFVDDIVRLTALRDRGLLTDEQFEEAKTKLLANA